MGAPAVSAIIRAVLNRLIEKKKVGILLRSDIAECMKDNEGGI